MRVFGLLCLVLALVIVGVLAKKQLSAVTTVPAAALSPGAAGQVGGDPRASSQQIQQQFKQSLDAAMQQQRPVNDDQ